MHSLRRAVLLCVLSSPALAQGTTPQSLDTVRVTSRTDDAGVAAARSVQVITRAEIQHHAARSLADVLALALGADVQQRSPAQADLGLRGSTFNQVVVLVDGVRVSDVQSGHYALDLAVPVGLIDRIEIMRGTGSALYGSDAIGGVVNIVTRTDASFGEAGTRAGSFGTASGRVAAGGVTGGTTLRAGIDADRSDGHRDGTDYRVVQLRGGAERTIGAARIAADAGIGARRFGAASFYGPYPSFEDTRSTTAAVRVQAPLSSHLAITGAVHARRHSDLFTLRRDDPAFYQNRHLGWQSGAEGSARLALTPILTVATGGELLDERLRSARLGHHAELRRAAFAEATLGRPAGVTLDVGMRGDWSPVVGGVGSPSVAAAIPIGGTLRLRASAARGFRAPSWTERFYSDPANIGDSTLDVERFTASEVGARFTPARWISADVALFERRARSLIDWARAADAPASAPWRTMNFARATYRGVEATIALPELGGVDWTLRGSGLRFDASAAPGTVGKYALRPITRTLGLSAATRLDQRTVLTIDALRERRSREDDHVQLAARLERQIAGVRLSLEGLNLGDDRWLDVTGQPSAPRSVFVGVGWSAR